MFRFKRLTLVVLALVLGACNQTPVGPEPLEFETDPRILRGTWVGEDINSDEALVVYLKASNPTQDGYQVAGFFQQNRAPFVINIAGTVTVPLAQEAASVTAQESSGCAVIARSQSSVQDGGTYYELCGEAPTDSPPRFNLTLTQRSDTGAVFTYNFSMTRQTSPADPNLLVRGNLVYPQGEPDTSPEPFEFTEDSHAIVQLWWWTGPSVADVPEELVASTTIEDISSFPIEYRLEGNAEEIFARRGEYYLNVGVFSGDGGSTGEKFAVGDLTNETYALVPAPGAEVEVEMMSLESCRSPGADGFCVPWRKYAAR